MKKLDIKIDVDGVLADLITFMINKYNEKYDQNVKYSDMKYWNVNKVFTKCNNNPFVELKTPDDIAYLPDIKGMIELVDKLHKDGHRIKFLTAIYPTNVEPRFRWLSSKFKWFKYSDMIISSDKSDCHGDILIDDYYDNHNKYFTYGFLLNQPWNSEYIELKDNIIRVYNSEEIYNKICDIAKCAN